MKSYIAIDPGERWTGVAIMTMKSENAYLSMSVLDNGRDYLRSARKLDLLLTRLGITADITLIVEDYRVRPVGHQRFTRGLTLRAIGAIEYVCESHSTPCYQIPPGNIKVELEAFGFEPILKKWKAKWQDPGSSSWEHAFSAWRLICQHILLRDQDRAVLLDGSSRPDLFKGSEFDLVTPMWEEKLTTKDLRVNQYIILRENYK